MSPLTKGCIAWPRVLSPLQDGPLKAQILVVTYLGVGTGAGCTGHTGTSLELTQQMEHCSGWARSPRRTGNHRWIPCSLPGGCPNALVAEDTERQHWRPALARPGLAGMKPPVVACFSQALILGPLGQKLMITPFLEKGKKSPWACVKLAVSRLSHFRSCYVGQHGWLMRWACLNTLCFPPCKGSPEKRVSLLTLMAKASWAHPWEGSRRKQDKTGKRAADGKEEEGATFLGMGDPHQWGLWGGGQCGVSRGRREATCALHPAAPMGAAWWGSQDLSASAWCQGRTDRHMHTPGNRAQLNRKKSSKAASLP